MANLRQVFSSAKFSHLFQLKNCANFSNSEKTDYTSPGMDAGGCWVMIFTTQLAAVVAAGGHG
jgi:hypothetical protein